MTKEVTTVSEEGYKSENQVRDFEVTIDATGEDAPDTLESLLAAYGSCYVPALRVGAEQRDVGDLGRIEIDVSGDLNDDDKLDAVQFTVRTRPKSRTNRPTRSSSVPTNSVRSTTR
nr:hypothetical protein [Halorussus sp. MSC15.2]